MPTAPTTTTPVNLSQWGMSNANGTQTPAPASSAPVASNPINTPITSAQLDIIKSNMAKEPTTPAPTVISNADLTQKIIPATVSKLQTASNRGTSLDANGNPINANGTLTNPTTGSSTTSTTTASTPTFGVNSGGMPTGENKAFTGSDGKTYTVDSNGQIVSGPSNGSYQVGANISQYADAYKTITGKDIPSVSSAGPTGNAYDDSILAKMQDIVTKGDANTATLIQNIQSKYQSLIDAQTEVNRQQQGSITQSLLVGGSARYAQLSSAGVTAAVVSSGIDKIATLTSQESDLITKAQQAQDDADYKMLSDTMAEYDKVTAAKQAEVDKLNTALQAQAQKLSDQKQAATQSDAVAKVMSTGETNPAKILAAVNAAGYNMTAEDVSDTLKALAPNADIANLSGDIKEFYAMKNAGLPLPPQIAKLPVDQQPYAYVAYKTQLTSKAAADAANKQYTLSSDSRGKLMGSGLTSEQIDGLQTNISEHGLTTVLANEPLTQDQKDVLTQVVTGKAAQFITSDWITKNFDADKLKAAASAAGDTSGGFLGFGKSVSDADLTTYTDSLMETVNTYRDAGLTDEEIFEKLNTKIK